MLRTLSGIAVAFIVIFIFGWVLHGIILADQYAALSHLYRTEDATRAMFGWLLGGQLLIATALVLMLNMYGPMLSTALGACFGFFVGLLSAGSQLVSFAVMPFPAELVAWWVGGTLLEMTILGALLADILKDE